MEASEKLHFDGKDAVVKKIYEKLVLGMKVFGPVKIEPKKTSIHLANRFGFAGVYTRSDYINLEIHLDHKLVSPRVVKVDKASANRFHHTVKLSAEKDVDRELLGWLKEAYQLKA
jgi:hypothetical protein